jgi:CubicO group peptidase (beta-lactamase class C family)
LKTLTTPAAKNYNCDTARITVRHHLTHTAQGEPGTRYAYNGFLFLRLSSIVDALSPKGYVRAIEDDILTPLGMNDTALGSADPNKADVIARMAKPYRLDADGALVESDTYGPPFSSINASVGVISTVLDLAKYDAAIDRDLVYSAQAKKQVWTPGVSPAGERFPYGLGWFVFDVPGSDTGFTWHYGWYGDAFSALLFKVPDRELTLILLACTDRASSPFWLGDGDPLRSAFVTTFLDAFRSW